MSKYSFGAYGTIYGNKVNIDFTFEDEKIIKCLINGIDFPIDSAISSMNLNNDYSPVYSFRPQKSSLRWNAFSYLKWGAFDRSPTFYGNYGEFEFNDIFRKDVIY